jgi:hypothetical protein
LVRDSAQKKAQAEFDLQVECGRVRPDTREYRPSVWEHRNSGLCTLADAHLRRFTELLEAKAQAADWLSKLTTGTEESQLGATILLTHKPNVNPDDHPAKV